ncbi:MAG: hypothetical protein GY761_13130 [Hyphomicrobiales bacterium]|nr:hypothetical protein [Hyphomicrobiales bacterium]
MTNTDVTVSLTQYSLASLEAFIEEHDDNLTHEEAIRLILGDWFIAP